MTIIRGWTLTAQEHAEEGQAEMRRGLGAIGATGARLRHPYYLALLAESCAQTGEVGAAVKMLGEGLAAAHHAVSVGTRRNCIACRASSRLRGPIHASAAQNRAAAGPSIHKWSDGFHQAIAIARRQHAKSLELRAAVSLARLWKRQGRRADAYELLAPIYHWFTEGFDTADIRDAEVLLRELGSKN